jgi:GTP-binding protein HflX
MRTVLALPEELALAELPRLLVYNKVDRVDRPELRALARGRPDAVFASATHRETIRPLIERVAHELKDKWEQSAKGPSVTPTLPEPTGVDLDPRDASAGELTTMEEMLRAAGKRVRARTVA